MRQNPHVRICGGPGSATTLVYPTPLSYRGHRFPPKIIRRAGWLYHRLRRWFSNSSTGAIEAHLSG